MNRDAMNQISEGIPPRIKIGPYNDSSSDLDLSDLLGILAGGRVLLAAVTAMVLVLGGIYGWLAPRVYEIDALVQVETDQKGLNPALGQMADFLGTEAPVTAEIEILRSRMVLGSVVDELNLSLAVTPNYFPLIGRALARHPDKGGIAGAPPGLRRYAWGGESIRVTDFQVPASWLGHGFTLEATGPQQFDLRGGDGSVLASGQAGSRLTFTLDGEPAALFVQDLAAAAGTTFSLARQPRFDVIDRLDDALRVGERGKLSGVIQLSLKGTDRELTTRILNKMVEIYLRQNVERKSAEAAKTLDFLKDQLPKLRTSVEEAESAINAYRLKQGSADLTKETELILQQAVTLEQARFELGQKREEALQRFTKDHAVVQALDAQISQLDHEKGGINSKVNRLPETQQELLRLSRDLEVGSALYISVLNNTQQLEVVKAGTVGNVRIIDPALPPTRPAEPRLAMVAVLSLLLGLMLGVSAVFVRRALHSGIEDPAEIENKLGLATYCSVPYSDVQDKLQRRLKRTGTAGETLLALIEPNGNAIEALRSLRTSLHFGQLEARNNILMLTGPSPGLGKSFVCANLGAVLAMSGKRVAVVDFDLRRGHLHDYFGTGRSPGLTDYVAGTAALEAIVHPTQTENLYFIPTGTVPPNPAELLLSDRVAEVVAHLSKKFDTVILDTPPVLAVTDAAVIGRYAGTTLCVLKAGEHSLRMVEDTLKRLQASGIAVRGTIFNQVGLSGRGRYGYKYGYSYGYYNYDYRPKTAA